MEQTLDRRVRKTKRAMTDALATLLLEKPLKHISVREIADKADINRGTFYLHYRDVYDMVEQLQSEIFEKFNAIVANHEPTNINGELFPLLVDLYALLAEHMTLAKVLISKNGDAAFVAKLQQVIREKCFTNLQEKCRAMTANEFEYFYHYIVSGCIGICSSWLSGGGKESPAEMAALTEQLIVGSAQSLI